MSFVTWILIIAASIILGCCILTVSELLRLAYWKLRTCPSCKKRYAFTGWDIDDWKTKSTFDFVELDEYPEDVYSRGVICPHCDAYNRTGRAASI